MKILIIGELYSSNLGDGVICENVKRIIEKANIKEKLYIDLVDISCRKGILEEENVKITGLKKHISQNKYIVYKIQAIKRKRKIQSICSKGYDLAIFAGGHLIMEYFVLPIYYFIKYLSKQKTKIIINACGVGDIESPILLHKIRKALNNCNIKYISSRDDVQKLKQKYIKKALMPIEKTYDPAIYAADNYQICKEESSQIIGLGIMKLSKLPEEKIVNFWRMIIEELDAKGRSWQFFCNGSKEDYNFACKCLKILQIPQDSKHIAIRPTKPRELVQLIAQYKSIISFRLHSHIIAYSLNIPTVAIIWDNKIKFFFKDLELEDRCFEIDNPSKEIVEKLLKIEIENYDATLKKKQKEVIEHKLLEAIIN